MPECPNDMVDLKSSEFGKTPSPLDEPEKLAEKKPLKSPEENTVKVHVSSSHSFEDSLSDDNTASLSQPVERLSGPKDEKNDEYGHTSQNDESNGDQGLDGESQSDALPTRKRSRKPTKRYIDEVVDPISRQSKRRREVSSSTFRDKSAGVKDHKKCQMVPKAIKLPDEESAVKAIQVPFGSLVHKECAENPAHNSVIVRARFHFAITYLFLLPLKFLLFVLCGSIFIVFNSK